MIARVKKSHSRSKSVPAWHAAFLNMLPAIQRQARAAFAHLDRENRDEAIQEAVTYATSAFKALWDRGTPELAYPSVLALHGIKRVKIGRMTATPLNCKDVSSRYCQIQKGLTVERLDKYDADEGCWIEILVEDQNAGPAETAAARIDVGEWMETLRRGIGRSPGRWVSASGPATWPGGSMSPPAASASSGANCMQPGCGSRGRAPPLPRCQTDAEGGEKL